MKFGCEIQWRPTSWTHGHCCRLHSMFACVRAVRVFYRRCQRIVDDWNLKLHNGSSHPSFRKTRCTEASPRRCPTQDYEWRASVMLPLGCSPTVRLFAFIPSFASRLLPFLLGTGCPSPGCLASSVAWQAGRQTGRQSDRPTNTAPGEPVGNCRAPHTSRSGAGAES